MASVSSYGHVTQPGSKDPFDYGVSIMPTFAPVRPPSMDASTIDDTFDFVCGHLRKRVDSDMSSFYFNPMELGAERRRSNHQKWYCDSMASETSLGPPISLYNKKRGSMFEYEVTDESGLGPGHSRTDMGAMRTAWTRHRDEQFRHAAFGCE
jgi:hypothetical protein